MRCPFFVAGDYIHIRPENYSIPIIYTTTRPAARFRRKKIFGRLEFIAVVCVKLTQTKNVRLPLISKPGINDRPRGFRLPGQNVVGFIVEPEIGTF